MHITGSDMEANLLLKHLFIFANIIYTMTLWGKKLSWNFFLNYKSSYFLIAYQN